LQAISEQRNDEDAAVLRRAMQEAFTRPDSASVGAWLLQAANAAESGEAFTAVTDAARTNVRPAIVVAGDYSTGKSSFIKRIFTEFNIEVPESLHIRADATTDEVRRYPMGRVDIVDNPGFQSRRAGHDELALSGTRGATLVIVVLHVNLLIGDSTALQAIANGTSTTVGKGPRILFIVNRCDELGVDPLDSTAELLPSPRPQTERTLRVAAFPRHRTVIRAHPRRRGGPLRRRRRANAHHSSRLRRQPTMGRHHRSR
jgi:signal recognition particle receptor subunit beta